MAITITNLGASSGGSATAPDYETGSDATSYSNASWTPPTSGLILLWVYNTRATSLGSAGTVSGNSLTWVNMGSDGVDAGSQTHRLTLYAAKASGATAGQTTVSFGADTQSSCIMQFQQVLGANLSGTTAGAFQQVTTNNSAGATSLTVTLATATSTAYRFVCGIGHGEPETTTPESGWTTFDEIYGTTPGHALLTMWHASSTSDKTPSASWTTSRGCAGVAAEIKEAASSESATLTDSVGLTDSISKAVGYVRTQSNTVGLTDALAKTAGRFKTLSDTVGVTDAISKAVNYARTISDTIGLTDLVEYVFTSGSGPQDWVVNLSDYVGLTDTVNKAVDYVKTLADTVGITDSVIREIIHISRAALKAARDLYNTLKGKRSAGIDLKAKRDEDNDLSGGI